MLEDEGIISAPRSPNRNSDPNAPKDTRDKVVYEMVETERKYVQDLEILLVRDNERTTDLLDFISLPYH
jgi:cell division control protein 24